MANVIPEVATCSFCVRSCKRSELNQLVAHIQQAADAAAMLVGAKVEVQVRHMMGERYPNLPMSEASRKIWSSWERQWPMPMQISYMALPTLEMYPLKFLSFMTICEFLQGRMSMSILPAFAEDAVSPRGDEVCIKGAKGLAMTALDLLEDPALREKIYIYQRKHVPAEYRK